MGRKFVHVSLDGDAVIDFCCDLPDVLATVDFHGNDERARKFPVEVSPRKYPFPLAYVLH
ncbi:hypothetical protein DSM106972_049370 [Dulcicalothrix desertica PCC 7102]|uniref:Uncharacterized protein n=1 Tax=Dulcicalothrix desertica PCC 7102 TaxID=232991 RepID=A0A3S1IXI2_9CYAN|nr:hypothetical protein DSM106972_049370 [Dulcicalothrix desertica PCC 7102]